MDAASGFHVEGWAVFALAAGAWFAYFRLKERGPKPFLLMLAAIVGGHLSAMAAVLLYNRLESLGYVTDWQVMQGSWRQGVPMSLVVGLVEEGTKLVPVLVLAFLSRASHRPRDGIFLAACAGLGFSAAENVMLAHQGLSSLDSVARALTTPVTHALFAAPWGLGIGGLLLRGRPAELALRFAASVSAHGAYDLLVAHPRVPLAVSAALVLGLWVWMLARIAPATVQLLQVRASSLRPAVAHAALGDARRGAREG